MELLPNSLSPGCIVQRTGLGCPSLGTEVENWKMGLCLCALTSQSWDFGTSSVYTASQLSWGGSLTFCVTIGPSLIKWSQSLPFGFV